MAGFDDLDSPDDPVKLLVLGDSGAGKSGGLASLIAAGYNVRVLDFDAGVKIIRGLLVDSGSIYRKPLPGLWPVPPTMEEIKARFRYETLTDPRRNVNGKLIPKMPPGGGAWQRGAKLLDRWDIGDDKLGPVAEWGTKDVLVIDTLSFAAKRAMEFVCSMNNRLGQQPHQSDFFGAQQLVESMLALLYDEGVKCNVVVNCHIKYIEKENEPRRGFPETIGSALNGQIGRYFNGVVQAKTVGFGAGQKHVISTVGNSVIELKNPAPLKVKKEYDLAIGLAEYFRDVRAPAQ